MEFNFFEMLVLLERHTLEKVCKWTWAWQECRWTGGWAFKWMDIGNWTGGAGGGILWNCKIKPGGSSGEDTTRWTGEQPCRWTVRRGGNR